MIRAKVSVNLHSRVHSTSAISHYTTHALYAPRTDHSHIPGYAVFVAV